MAEETLSTSTIDQAEGTKVEKEINPYFAIEEKRFIGLNLAFFSP